jgi:hypothetical protein
VVMVSEVAVEGEGLRRSRWGDGVKLKSPKRRNGVCGRAGERVECRKVERGEGPVQGQ